MRRSIAFPLILIISLQAFYNLGVTIYWLANRPYIAAELCENRDRPEMHCEGKCFLKKKLTDAFDKARGKQKPTAPVLKKGLELAEQPAPSYFIRPYLQAINEPTLTPTIQHYIEEDFGKSFFHPPNSGC